MKARDIVESEEWKVEAVAEGAPTETIFANGASAVGTRDLATAEKMLALLEKKAGGEPAPAGGGAHADHMPAPPQAASSGDPDAGKDDRIMHRELAALVAEARGDRDKAIALLREAVAVEESMRPPAGAATPIKPSHEMLGEVLLRAGKAADAASAFEKCLLRMPRRARSLMGAARAYAAAGDRELAAERLQTLRSFWKGRPLDTSSMQ
jgi:tetratricopeptide (TPR) repeat protein